MAALVVGDQLSSAVNLEEGIKVCSSSLKGFPLVSDMQATAKLLCGCILCTLTAKLATKLRFFFYFGTYFE